MVTRALYIVGGAGVGKSTFTGELLALLGADLGPLELIRNLPMANGTGNPVSGHRVTPGDGLYLGKMRDQFPGSDGLSRTCGTTAAVWVTEGNLPAYIIGEGATLTTARFLTALGANTELLIVHLVAPMETVLERCAQRGSNQNLGFVKASGTRAANAALAVTKAGLAGTVRVDTTDPVAWEIGLDMASFHVRLAFPEHLG